MPIGRRRFLIGAALTAAGGAGAAAYWKRRHLNGLLDRLLHPDLRWGTPADLGDPYDVCIIGSGPAGATLGLELAKRGQRTLILESGLAPGESDPRIVELENYPVDGDIPYSLATSRYRGVGGTSVIWTGRCSRLHPLDFESNAYTPTENPWPIGYDDLEPYYNRADQTLNVRGAASSPYRAPRTMDYPYPAPDTVSATQALLAKAQIQIDFSPTSRSRIQPGPVRAANDLLPLFTAERKATLIPGLTVNRLETRNGRAELAEVSDLDGRRYAIRADRFVIACGAAESARLLLLSSSAEHPNGLGNQGDQVGRSFTEHPNLTFFADFDSELERAGQARSHQFYDAFKLDGLGSMILAAKPTGGREFRLNVTIEMEPNPENRISLSSELSDAFGQPSAHLDFNWTDLDRQTLERSRALCDAVFEKLGATPTRELPTTWSHHHIGTCRMGTDPETSVTDTNLRVHGTRNVFVLSSAVFVTGGAAHPTLTIVALAHRLADHLTRV